MALENVLTIQHLHGVLADLDELTDTTTYPAGSRFHAIDTGEEFVKFAGGWLLDLRRARAIKQSELLS